jgi:hypothetical protein
VKKLDVVRYKIYITLYRRLMTLAEDRAEADSPSPITVTTGRIYQVCYPPIDGTGEDLLMHVYITDTLCTPPDGIAEDAVVYRECRDPLAQLIDQEIVLDPEQSLEPMKLTTQSGREISVRIMRHYGLDEWDPDST